MKELVSIYMLAYNHAPWIEKAIRSIVEQKTEYSFKLYVHDDASSDGTTDIIKRLEKEFPDKIEGIYQTENQYSKGVKIHQEFLFPRMKGEYIMICEGDDYWTSPNKIQTQVDYMNSHPDCTLCFGNAVIIDTEGRKLRNFFPTETWNDKGIIKKLRQPNGADFNVEEMLLLDFAPTAALCYRRKVVHEFERFSITLDLVSRLVSTSMGYAHYCNEVFSAYRVGNSSSASGSIRNSYDRLKKSFYDLHSKLLREFDEYTGCRYTAQIEHEIKRKEIDLFYGAGEEYYNQIVKHECYKELTLKKKSKIFAKRFLQRPVRVYKRMKYKNDTLAKM